MAISDTLQKRVSLYSVTVFLTLLTGSSFASVCSDLNKDRVFLSAQDSSFEQLGWMKGSPPPAEKILRLSDGSFWSFPALRYSVAHMSEFLPTTLVHRRNTLPSNLNYALNKDIDNITFTPWDSDDAISWNSSLYETYTDGIIVLHKGNVVYEQYLGGFKDYHRHALMSVTKSFVGTLALDLVHKGLLDESRLVSDYIPELASSGFGDATVKDVVNMTTSIIFDEDYTNPNSEIWAFSAAGNPLPKPSGYEGPVGYFEYLPTVQKEGEHGDEFAYKTANTEVLGWLIARVTGISVAEHLEELLWSQLGVEQDAFFQVDEKGTPFAGGGLNMSLRDMARFGELIRNSGKHNGKQLLHPDILQDIISGGQHPAFNPPPNTDLESWSYRSMWWVTGKPSGSFMARGVHGQNLYIDPTNEIVIARFASHPIAANSANNCITLPAYDALIKYLTK